jgi:hypothetical protein
MLSANNNRQILSLSSTNPELGAHNLSKGAFTLGVKDSSIKSPNSKLNIPLGTKPIYNKDFMLSEHSLNIKE